MEDLILILVLSGIGLVTLLVSVWLFYRKKRKTTEKKRAIMSKVSIVWQRPRGLFPWLIFSAVQAAPLGKWLPWG